MGQDKDSKEEIFDTAALTLDLNKYAKLVEHLLCSDMPGATFLFSMYAFFPRLHLQGYKGEPLTGLVRMTSWWWNSPGDHRSLKGGSCKIGWVNLWKETIQLPVVCQVSVPSTRATLAGLASVWLSFWLQFAVSAQKWQLIWLVHMVVSGWLLSSVPYYEDNVFIITQRSVTLCFIAFFLKYGYKTESHRPLMFSQNDRLST